MDWLRRLLGVQAQSPEATPIDRETVDRIRDTTTEYVQRGFMEREDILEIVVDIETYESPDIAPDVLQATAALAYDEAVQDQLLRQAEWPAITDCDRLDAAFDALNEVGIISRQDFSCCGSCGIGEIRGEMKQAQADGKPVIGYSFYHEQDTDGAKEGGGVYLSYGSIRHDEASDIEIGHAIVSKLHDAGLTARWNGTLRTRIFIPLEWRRRMAVSSSPE